uniref:HTH myb-type domain-containing protein n=1 Tax=Gongylonema pulchrum TaxID=637853 RepID=A0A183E896_9BILA
LKAKLRQTLEHGRNAPPKKVPITRFLYPYFRDSHDMEPPRNKETELMLYRREYNPLLREEKKCTLLLILFFPRTVKECQILRSAVRKSLIEARIQPFLRRRELLAKKIQASGQETAAQQIAEWRSSLAEQERLINYHKNLPDSEIFMGDYSEVDWVKIAQVDFSGNRTALQVRLKWINEQCPKWSKEPWTAMEINCLRAHGYWNNWNVVAEKMGTNRTPFQCFVKFKSEIEIEHNGRPWTKEEDAHLMVLTHCIQVNGKMFWGKSIWVNVLDRSVKIEPWTVDEDEKLLEGIKIFGRGEWSRIATMIPGRSASHCKSRFRSLLSAKVKVNNGFVGRHCYDS